MIVMMIMIMINDNEIMILIILYINEIIMCNINEISNNIMKW